MNKAKLWRWVGVIAILLCGLIHLYDAPEEYQEAQYMGILFFAFFLGAFISAIGIYPGQRLWGWVLGGLISIGAIIGYLISRTVGMPLMEVEEWGPPLAYFSIFLELIVFALFLKSISPSPVRAHS